MAIVNSGFDGTVDEVQYAKMWANGGLDACTGSGWQVTAVNNTTVAVAAGDAFAKGVLSVNDGAINVTVARPASGSTWYVIARRINWSLNQVAAVAVASNTTSSDTTVPTAPPAELLPTLLNQPGSQYDHPLAWVWVNSGTGRAIFDLRSQPPATRLQLLDQGILRLDTNRGTAAQRDAKYGVPTNATQRLALQGARWYNTALGTYEQYYAFRDDGGAGTNPLGATVAGWYADDTGDVILPASNYQTGFSAGAGNGIHLRRVNGMVTVSGIINRATASGTGTVATIPAGFLTQNRQNALYESSAVIRAEFNVETNGTFTLTNNVNNSNNGAILVVYPAYL